MKSYQDIIKWYDMVDLYDWFVKNNQSNDLPYHNLFHAQCMVENCYDGAQYHNLPFDATRQILCAALFHDFNHSGGKEEDMENIYHAILGVQRCAIELDQPLADIPDMVIECIRCTEYPFVYESFTIEQRIIRDADLMQFRFGNWKDVLDNRLRAEMEVKIGKPITQQEMYDGNQAFWRKVHFYTDWGKHVFTSEGYGLINYLKL